MNIYMFAIYIYSFFIIQCNMITTFRRYLGPLQLLFLKDSWGHARTSSGRMPLMGPAKGEVEPSRFLTLLLTEVSAITRAHVLALGGNALLSYTVITQVPEGGAGGSGRGGQAEVRLALWKATQYANLYNLPRLSSGYS